MFSYLGESYYLKPLRLVFLNIKDSMTRLSNESVEGSGTVADVDWVTVPVEVISKPLEVVNAPPVVLIAVT